MRALMVQGVSSSSGKSLISTALCRAFHRRGIDVAPFKAQNMSNNARVVAGGEIGTAQYLQALAAGIEPDVRMNPILVKPEGDNRSQVVVLGKANLKLSRLPWRERSELLWPTIERSLKSLRAEHELLVLEGAGSPAEVNLRRSDLANMRTAYAADARVLLVSDIDRGGAFAHLYGTWALLPEYERDLLYGFVLNKFRGDRTLLPPAPERLEALTGVPTVGVLPWLEHGLPDEDGVTNPPFRRGSPLVAVIRYPTASNLDEFKQLELVANVQFIDQAGAIDGADLLILPGSKHVSADLAWLRRRGLADAIRRRADEGLRVVGICGGMQMLGERIDDAADVDGSAEGLALLPLRTHFVPTKETARSRARFTSLPAPWAVLSGKAFDGYQIRHGQTTATGTTLEALAEGLGFVSGPVLGIYAHGLFEETQVLGALFGAGPARSLDQALDELADAVEAELEIDQLLAAVANR